MTEQDWINKAALYEVLALGFLKVTPTLVEAVASGEYADALSEIGELNGLDATVLARAVEALRTYAGRGADGEAKIDADAASDAPAAVASDVEPDVAADAAAKAAAESLFHELRVEHTHLFVGAPEPAVSPYAGIWWAREAGVEPLLFVNSESMAVERFMRSCGVGQPEGTNEPLDHVGSELEFLQYLCLIRSERVTAPEGIEIAPDAYESFLREHFSSWTKKFAAAVQTEARIPFYRALAEVLEILPED